MNFDESLQRVFAAVDGLSDADAAKRFEGQWSILGILEHLYILTKRNAVRYAELLKEPAQSIPTQDLSWATNRTRKINAPEPFHPTGSITSLAEAKTALLEARAELRAVIQSANPEDLDTHGFFHPGAGAVLSLRQLIEVTALHDLRHLEQIEEIKQAL